MLERFISHIHRNNLFAKNSKLLIAVSGGVDSVVLAHLCKQAGWTLGIAHCNFQLRGLDSDRDEKFVGAFAGQLQVPFHVTRFDTMTYAKQEKVSIQVAARDLRYNWFEEVRLQEGYDYILTAHHADDSIETVLMNFFRGTGISGLTGIRDANHKIRRPLLFATRQELEHYLHDNGLSFVQDDSNLHDDYTRNYFRNTLLPQITGVYPEVQQNLLNNIERFKGAEVLYRAEVNRLRERLLQKKGETYWLPVLLLKRTGALTTVLLELLKPYGFKPAQIPEVMALLDSESGRYMLSASHRLLKDRTHLIISSLEGQEQLPIVIDGEGAVRFAYGVLNLAVSGKPEISKNEQEAFIDAALIAYPLVLRPWRTGDYFYPLGMPKKKKLSRFFIDKKLPLAEKEKIWVLEMNKKIIWVVGYRIDDRFKVTHATGSVLKITRQAK